ncbi:hypothetical protein GQ457_11G006270 [Hibiscus cannabinus]
MNINNSPIAIESPSEPSTNPQSVQTLASTISSLSSSSRTLPSNHDFHFFNNFNDFKLPIDQIAQISDSLLGSIGSSAKTLCIDNAIGFPNDIADDEAYDWLVDVNDQILERLDVSIDEFKNIRNKQEETGGFVGSDQDIDGFRLVYGKKKKKGDCGLMDESVCGIEGGSPSSSGVKVKEWAVPGGTTGKAKVPFHIPTIRKPQEEYNILVNNSNKPFEHAWLQKSDDGQRFVHPMETLSVTDFLDKDISDSEPVQPPSIESTPFKLVEEVKDLKELAAKLSSVNEFAVDLEHNQYRSFLGLTCLMQISTRTEDFIVDTLKLRIHVGPYLREVFKDPTKKKVMHGADRDIVWLQRDFGIYICNLFDTGQASRVLKMERNSLEHLLQHFCGITANKEYQNADWRLRPLPAVMLRYAREDTHYLLYIYDLMRIKLISMPVEPEHCDAPLVEQVYKRSSDVCMQLYEKELLTENSYLHIYGLQAAGFNAEQLAIVSGLYEWRDRIARSEDESTGYILPNKILIEIAKQMPATAGKLRRLLKSKHPYVERNLGAVVSIIKRSMQNAVIFEAVAEQLKMGRVLLASEHVTVNDGANWKIANDRTGIIDGGIEGPDGKSVQPASLPCKVWLKTGSSISGHDMDKKQKRYHMEPDLNDSTMSVRESLAISGHSPPSVKATGATVQVLKKPIRGFGALLGNAASKKKYDIGRRKEESKLEQIRSSVNLSFQSCLGTEQQQSKRVAKEPIRVSQISPPEEPPTLVASQLTFKDIIMLENNSNVDESIDGGGSMEITHPPNTNRPVCHTSKTNKGDEESPSPSDLSTSSQQCTQPFKVKKSKEQSGPLQIKPFDYETTRKQFRFGEDAEEESGSRVNSARKKKSAADRQLQIEDGNKRFPQARRRQAFPASGNRSATFR